jgi:hypothetical protein
MAFIYALTDPRNDEVRYIGQTKYRINRYTQHKRNRDDNAAKHEWIAELNALGLEPGCMILEEVDWDHRFKRESQWIKHYQEQGADLTNQVVTRRPPRDRYAEQQIALRRLMEEM